MVKTPEDYVQNEYDDDKELVETILVDGVPELEGIRLVTGAEDLPDAVDGVRTLDSSKKGYWFMDIVADPATLDPNGVPLVGFHGSAGGYIHTGGDVAFQTNGTGFYADNFFGHAPGGQLFDLQADNTTRFLVTDTAFFDPVGLGDIADLGVIDGYKVVSFKSVNFENFAQGLTLAGDTDKTFFETCPIREVSGSNATFLTTDATYNSEILKLVGCYVKNVQTDTTIVDVTASGLPNNYLKYINVDHDTTITKSQLFEGFSREDVGVVIRDSFPIADSVVGGDLSLDAQTTVTGSGSGPTELTQGTWTLNLGDKTSQASPGKLQYDAKSDRDVGISARVTVVGANTNFSLWVAKNGTRIPRSRVDDSTSGSSKPTTVNYGVQIEQASSDTPDTFSLVLENTGGTADLDAATANIELAQI